MICARPGCGHRREDHADTIYNDIKPCDVKSGSEHCTCFAFTEDGICPVFGRNLLSESTGGTMKTIPELGVEERYELSRAITFYLENHRASNEPMHFFLTDLIKQLD